MGTQWTVLREEPTCHGGVEIRLESMGPSVEAETSVRTLLQSFGREIIAALQKLGAINAGR